MNAYLPPEILAALLNVGPESVTDFPTNGGPLPPIPPALRAKLEAFDPYSITAAGRSLDAPALVRPQPDLGDENVALRKRIASGDAPEGASGRKSERNPEEPWLTIGPLEIGGKPKLPTGPTGYEMTLNGMPRTERPGGGLFGMGGLPQTDGGPRLPELRAPNRGDVAGASNTVWDGVKAAGGAVLDGTAALNRNLLGPESVIGRATGTIAGALDDYQRSMRELHGAPAVRREEAPAAPVSDPTRTADLPAPGGASSKPSGFIVGGQAEPDLWPIAPPAVERTAAPAVVEAPSPPPPAAAPRRPVSGVPTLPPRAPTVGGGAPAAAASSSPAAPADERYRTRDEIAADLDKRVAKENSFDAKEARWNALMALGLQMAASNKTSFGQALAEGGIAALNQFGGEKKAARDRDERNYARSMDRERAIEAAYGTERQAKHQTDVLAETRRAHNLDAAHRGASLELQRQQLAQQAAQHAATLSKPDWQLTTNDKGEAVYYDVNSGQTRSPGPGLKPYSASAQRGVMTPMDLSLMEQRIDTMAKHQASASGALEGTPEWSRAYLDSSQRLRTQYNMDGLNGMVYGRMGMAPAAPAQTMPQLPPLPPGAQLDSMR